MFVMFDDVKTYSFMVTAYHMLRMPLPSLALRPTHPRACHQLVRESPGNRVVRAGTEGDPLVNGLLENRL